ncbi:MAG: hydroxyacid dehydrogenase [Phycisphaera sp.]|nr:hydroxyacid dehydrogenase [Phycisphaera sp.]
MNVPQLITSLVVIAVIFHVLLIGVAYGIFLERKIAAWAQDRIGPNRVGFGGLVRPLVNLVLYLPLLPLKKLGLCADVDPDRLWQNPKGEWFTNFHFLGFGQAIADGVKFVGKEDYNPGNVDKTLFILAPMLAVLPAAIGWAVVPWGGTFVFPAMSFPSLGLEWGDTVVHFTVANVNIGVIYMLAIGSLAVYGVTVGAWAANNKYTFLGGIRATAQMLSYEIPMGLCVLAVLLLTGTANPGDIVAQQASYAYGIIPQWIALQQPIACILFFVCILAESNRAPFDLAECEQELIGGFHTEYSSMKFALFFLGEYMHMMTGCAFLTLLFLGGWHLPYVDLVLYGTDTAHAAQGYHDGGLFGMLHNSIGFPEWFLGLVGMIIKVHVFLFKVLLLLALMMWVRWTLPRFRFDQLMKLAWRSLVPLTLLILVTTGTFVFMGWQHYMWLGNGLILVIALGVAPLIPQGPPVNRRVPLPGSRFSPLPSE